MTEETGGRSATEIRDAHLLHEALTIALAPQHMADCVVIQTGNKIDCDCGIVARALACKTITRHAPTQATAHTPCAEHTQTPMLRDVPGFYCPECRERVELRCRQDSKRWPCEEINEAMQATKLTTSEAVDEYLGKLTASA